MGRRIIRRPIIFFQVRAGTVSANARGTPTCQIDRSGISVLSQEGVLLPVAVWGSSGCYNSRRTDVAHFQPMR